eukprot:UN06272
MNNKFVILAVLLRKNKLDSRAGKTNKVLKRLTKIHNCFGYILSFKSLSTFGFQKVWGVADHIQELCKRRRFSNGFPNDRHFFEFRFSLYKSLRNISQKFVTLHFQKR